MRWFLIPLLATALICLPIWAQTTLVGPVKAVGPVEISNATASGSSPAVVDFASNFTGTGTLTYPTSLTIGNSLIIFTAANDTTTTHTCSDSKGNSFPTSAGADLTIVGAGGAAITGKLYHIPITVGGTGDVITCAGTTPTYAVWQLSGCAANPCVLSATSAGTNASSATSTSAANMSPAAFTPSTAAVVLLDGFASATGNTITATQTDTNYSVDSTSCLTGATCFVAGMGHRTVTVSASYSDGWTATNNTDWVAFNAAYK